MKQSDLKTRSLNTTRRSSAAAIFCLVLAGIAPVARADSIDEPTSFGDGQPWGLSTWAMDCAVEFGCSYDYITVGNSASTGDGIGDVNVMGPSDANFAYSEVDDPSGNWLNFTLINLGGKGPLTVSFSDLAGNPNSVVGFGTTLFSGYGDFTATLSAYNYQGQLLGSTTSSSVDNDAANYYYRCQMYLFPCYSAFVGIEDTSYDWAQIASVVISTTATIQYSEGPSTINNTFDLGLVGVIGQGTTPEPGTFGLALLAMAGLMALQCSSRRLSPANVKKEATSQRNTIQ